jgi:hypothetical protein
MPNVIRFVFTVVFGVLWWWVYNHVGASLAYLMILGSVLAVCSCCCQGAEKAVAGEWAPNNYLGCIRRCLPVTVVLILGLFFVGFIVTWVSTGAAPTAADLKNIVLAAIFAPLFVRIICCAYE